MTKKSGLDLDWSKGHFKWHLIEPRRYLWLPDTVAKLAAWVGLKPGMTAVDVGCGLGYMGYTYWPYFGKGGRYFGVDTSSQLLRDAEKGAKAWAVGGKTHFLNGNAYDLPFPDDFAHLVMCQTLLIHLQKPEKALAEMVRVAKPGGLVFCHEPDNLSSFLVKGHSSLPEWTVEEHLFLAKVNLICNQGRIRLGRGDFNLGPKIPMMMKKAGLRKIDVRMNDRPNFTLPPYEGPIQKWLRTMDQKEAQDHATHRFYLKRAKEEYLAGKGRPREFEKYRRMESRRRKGMIRQVKEGIYGNCTGFLFFAIKGEKP